MRFHTTIQLGGKTATGIEVPADVVAALNAGNRPPVRVTVAGYSYRTTVARMGGKFMFPVSAAVREQAGVAAGEEVDVEIEIDDAPREVAIPAALGEMLDRNPDAKQAFERLSYSNQKRHALAVEGAKTEQTRQRRLAQILSELGARP